MTYETLGALRTRLLARLGFGASGQSAGVILANVNSMLAEAQVDLYAAHDWARLRQYEDVTIGTDEYLTDYPTAANPDRIKAISISLNGVWTPPLKKGIPPQLYTTQSNNAPPARWEPYAQIETWPMADQQYTARIFFIAALGRFTQTDDLATIDSDLVFKLALAYGKAHYRHPDAKLYLEGAEALKRMLKAKSWGQDVFSASDYIEAPAQPKPVVV